LNLEGNDVNEAKVKEIQNELSQNKAIVDIIVPMIEQDLIK